MKNKRGISLITLIITIIIIIILAAAIILVLAKNNPIESAREANYKSNVNELKAELTFYISDQLLNSMGEFNTAEFNVTTGAITSVLKNIEKIGMVGKLEIQYGKIVYLPQEESNLSQTEIEWLEEIDVKEKDKLKYTDGKYFIIDKLSNAIIGYEEELAIKDGITEIVIPRVIDEMPVDYIYVNAFKGINSITSIVVPGNVFYIGQYAFSNMENLKYAELIEGVRFLSSGSFMGAGNLDKIVLPNSLERIGSSTFGDCTNLKSITIPTKIKNIESGTFYGCGALKDIIIPENVENIEYGAFESCTGLENITFPRNLKSIEDSAFGSCTNLANISVNSDIEMDNGSFADTAWYNSQPDGLVYLGNTLYGYKSEIPVTELNIKEGTTSIAGSRTIVPYNFRSSITNVILPSSMKSIGERAFEYFENVNITIPSSIEYIGERAFGNCYNANITFKNLDNLEYIGNEAFDNTPWEDSQPDGIIYLGNILYSAKGKITDTNLIIKEGTKHVSPNAFDSSIKDNVQSIVFPNSLKTIGERAFYSFINVSNITFSNSLESIEENAFERNTALESIQLPSTLNSLGGGGIL